MRKIVAFAILSLMLAVAAGAENGPTVLEAGAHAQSTLIPLPDTLRVVPCLDLTFLPLGIGTGEGSWNWLGLSLKGGLPFIVIADQLAFSPWIETHFVGRFGVIPKVVIDMTAGFGFRINPAQDAFYGIASLRAGLPLVDRLMAQAGIFWRFWPNPAYASDIYNEPQFLSSLGLSLGLVWRFLGPAG